MAKIKIKQAKPEDIPAIQKIADQSLGRSYIDKDRILSATAFVAHADNQIVGFSLLKIFSMEIFEETSPKIAGLMKRTYLPEEKVGLMASMVVAPRYRGRGLGQILCENALDYFKKQAVVFSYMTAWKHDGRIPVEGIANRLGFKKLEEIPDYWCKDSLAKHYSCPHCGNPPCHCTAVIFARAGIKNLS